MSSLLPPNANELERNAAEALAQLQRVPVPLRTLWNPDTCPVELLPYLAWSFSVDRWVPTWSEATKRQVIKASYFVHSRKGTIGALRRAVQPVGYLVKTTEWWQLNPPGPPGTFSLEVATNDNGISEEMYAELELLIADAKPVSRHLIGLAIGLGTVGRMYVGASISDGDELSVYPPDPRPIEVSGSIGQVGREHSIDTLDVFS